jgi:hypothetical protein
MLVGPGARSKMMSVAVATSIAIETYRRDRGKTGGFRDFVDRREVLA